MKLYLLITKYCAETNATWTRKMIEYIFYFVILTSDRDISHESSNYLANENLSIISHGRSGDPTLSMTSKLSVVKWNAIIKSIWWIYTTEKAIQEQFQPL